MGKQGFQRDLLLNLGVILLATSLIACSSSFEPDAEKSVSGGTPQKKPEPANCSPVASVTNPITITATAQFKYRPTTAAGLFGDPLSANIKYAEVAILNSSGTVIQCGETDVSGAISLQIPKDAGTYTLRVYSRSGVNATKVKASVLEDIYSNQPYSISQSFTVTAGSSSPLAAGTLTASARSSESAKIEGAAFNIFNDIYIANERIRTMISNSSFVAPKVSIYWKAGFNPYSYFGYPDSLSSFYLNGYRELYILGGKNGDVKNTDTDHFDDSVVLHEYGHFLEDVYGKSESSGGSHNGNGIIDPRLAWSEGWANFFQSAIIDDQYYIDTVGFKNDTVEGTGSSAGITIYFDLSQNGSTAAFDAVSLAGEGTFREISISRTLYKTYSTVFSTSSIAFTKIWNVFSSTSSGFGSSTTRFRSVGYFNEFLYADYTNWTGTEQTNWNNVLSNEKQNNSRKDYADPTTLASSCAKYPRAITPTVDFVDASGYYKSNHLTANDFYLFYYDGTLGRTINLLYSQSGSQTIDLDLSLLKLNYVPVDDEQEFKYGVTNNAYAVRSRRLNPSIESGTESMSLNGLSAGYYLINVKAVTYNRSTKQIKTSAQLNGTANYTLLLITGSTTEFICPAH